MFHESLGVAHRTGALKLRDLKRVTVDTTVQLQAITFPTDAKLMKECLSGKIFSTLVEAMVLVARSRRMYNAVRPHSAVECKATGRGSDRDPRSASGPALTPPV